MDSAFTFYLALIIYNIIVPIVRHNTSLRFVLHPLESETKIMFAKENIQWTDCTYDVSVQSVRFLLRCGLKPHMGQHLAWSRNCSLVSYSPLWYWNMSSAGIAKKERKNQNFFIDIYLYHIYIHPLEHRSVYINVCSIR